MQFCKALACAITFLSLASEASAQDFPARHVTMVVPFAAGGLADSSARVIAKAVGDALSKPVIIENRAGAAGIVGMEYIAKSKPDGYTIGIAGGGQVLTNKYIYKDLTYDSLASFTPIHSFFESSLIVVVKADSQFKTIGDLLDYSKKHPARINFGSTGTGSTPHLAGKMLQIEAGVVWSDIPYKGTPPAIIDLLAGAIDVIFDYSIVVKSQIEAGKLRALAVTSGERMKSFPGVPTLKESGYPGAIMTAWSIFVSPANTPKPIVEKLAAAFGEALQKPEVISYFEAHDSVITAPLAGSKLMTYLQDEDAKIAVIVKKVGLKPE